MVLVLAEATANRFYDRLVKDIDKLNSIIRTNISVSKVASNSPMDGWDVLLTFDEFDGGNSIALFGVWYDLRERTFSISRPDTVTGIKLFTIDELFAYFRLSVPDDVNDRILQYKGNGKLDTLFTSTFATEGYATFLQYFLSSDKSSGSKTETVSAKRVQEVVKAIVRLKKNIERCVFVSKSSQQAINIVSTCLNYDSLDEDVELSESDLYRSSCKGDIKAGERTSLLKGAQAKEIIEAQSIMNSDGYLDVVKTSIDAVPALKGITASERSSLKISLERSAISLRQERFDSAGRGRTAPVTTELRKMFIEIGKCAKKIQEA